MLSRVARRGNAGAVRNARRAAVRRSTTSGPEAAARRQDQFVRHVVMRAEREGVDVAAARAEAQKLAPIVQPERTGWEFWGAVWMLGFVVMIVGPMVKPNYTRRFLEAESAERRRRKEAGLEVLPGHFYSAQRERATETMVMHPTKGAVSLADLEDAALQGEDDE